MPDLTTEQSKQVESSRHSTRPSVFSPTGGGQVQVGEDFESWLILTPKSTKARAVEWITELLTREADDDYQNLLKETLDSEEASIEVQSMDLAGSTSAFTEWRSNPNVAGFEDVAEIGWLFQELQQGFAPYQEDAELTHYERLRAAVKSRFQLSKDSEATRKERLNSWIAALNAY